MQTFETLGLSEPTLEVVRQKGFVEPTPIQSLVIPALLNEKKDLIGQAQTGTGKTAAFGLPLLEQLEESVHCVQALVLTPTRELAIQVCQELSSLKGSKKLSIVPIYGGASFGPQLREIVRGIDVIVGTPGRVLDHLNRGRLKLDSLRFLILDEADEMLNLGFKEELEGILEKTPQDRRTMLFSATMPVEIQQIAERYMRDHSVIRAKNSLETSRLTDHIYYEVREPDRFEALCRVVEMSPEFYGIVFCRTRTDTSEVATRMANRGYQVGALHGDYTQAQREAVLNRFRRRQIRVLVATDVAARGIDIQDLTHVVNFSIPQSPDAYIHRIGRTGRAGKKGTAVTLITPAEYYKLQYIRRGCRMEIRKEKLPNVDEVIEAKKAHIRTRVAESLGAGLEPSYRDMARELLTWCEAEELIAALLEQAFSGELDRSRYSEIVQYEHRTPQRGLRQEAVKLFITRGRKDGVTPKKLSRMIEKITRMPRRKIRDLELGERGGFVTLPAQAAKVLLDTMSEGGGAPLVVKAKPKSEKPKSPKPKSEKRRWSHAKKKARARVQ